MPSLARMWTYPGMRRGGPPAPGPRPGAAPRPALRPPNWPARAAFSATCLIMTAPSSGSPAALFAEPPRPKAFPPRPAPGAGAIIVETGLVKLEVSPGQAADDADVARFVHSIRPRSVSMATMLSDAPET